MPMLPTPSPTGGRIPSAGPARPGRRVVFALLAALACSGSQREADEGSEAERAQVLAVVDGVEITASEVDAPLRIDLHDLEQAAYERRLERIRTLAGGRLGAGSEPGSTEWDSRVEIRLEPPEPPRFEIPDSAGPIRGPATAPVTLVEFVDLESPHCRRLQADLLRLLDRYPDRVRLEIRDLPLPYHRRAFSAAKAAHCAGEQDAYWDYHDRLLLEQPALAPSDLERHAGRLGLDRDRFSACLGSDRHEARIRADLSLAASLGVHRAPTLFVNGLYPGGSPSAEAIDRLVRRELERLGLDATPESRQVGGEGPGAAARETASEEELDWPRLSPEEMPEPEIVITLDRGEVAGALEDRRALDRKLQPSAADFSGQRLLKLRKVDEDDLYARLGLEEGDVLMLVDGRFVTAERNLLWDALSERDSVTLLVMRRGLPHTYLYRIR